MKRRNLSQIKEDILELLSDSKEHSVNQICKKINSNWLTVSEALKALKQEDKLSEKKVGNITFFTLSNPDTYFRLPIKEKEKKLCRFMHNKIIKQWKDIKGDPPNPLVIQKITTDIADTLSLPITRGWYLYGKMSPVVPQLELQQAPQKSEFPENDFKELDKNKIIQTLQKITLEYTKCKTNSEVIKKHYQRAPEIYKLKLEISKVLAFEKNEKDSQKEFTKLLAKFLFHSPPEDDLIKNIYLFVITVGKIIKINKFSDLNINTDIKIAFEKLWELIGSYMFFKDIIPSIDDEAERKQIEDFSMNLLNLKERELSDILNSLKDKYFHAINKQDFQLDETDETTPKNKEIPLAFSSMN